METASSQAAPSAAPQAQPSSAPAADASATQQQTTPNNQQAAAPADRAWLGDLAKDPAFEKFKDPTDVAKSYKELQSQLGKPRYDVPAPDAPPEVTKEFYKKMGVPDAPEAYGLKPPENYPKEIMGDYDTAMLGEFSKVAHGLNLTPAQAAGIQQWYDGMTPELVKAQQEAHNAAIAEANTKMDGHFTKLFGDKKSEAVERVKQSITAAIPDQAMRQDLEKALPNEALVVIAAVEKHYREKYGASDQNIGDPGRTSGRSIEEVRKEAQTLMASKEYRNVMDPGHKAVRDKVDQMYKDIADLTASARKK